MLITEDSIWCCILPAYCDQQHNSSQYMKYSKLTLAVSIVVIVVVCTLVYFFDNRSHQFFKLSFFKKDSNVVSIASGSLLKMKRFLNDAACQTTEYYGRERGTTDVPRYSEPPRYAGIAAAEQRRVESPANGVGAAVVGTGSLKTIRNAIDEFVRVIDHEETRQPAGELTNRCPPKPPPLPSAAKPLTPVVSMPVPVAVTAAQQ